MEDRLREFRRELMQIIKEGENEDRIYQLNMQLFPLTEIHDKKKRKNEK